MAEEFYCFARRRRAAASSRYQRRRWQAVWWHLLGFVPKQSDGNPKADRVPESCVSRLCNESLGARFCGSQDHPETGRHWHETISHADRVCREDRSAAEHRGSTAQELKPCFKASEVRCSR